MKFQKFAPLGPPSKALVNLIGETERPAEALLLDAGCGYGRNAVALALRGFSVVCVDQDFERLNALVRLAPRHLADLRQPDCAVGRLYPLLAQARTFVMAFCRELPCGNSLRSLSQRGTFRRFPVVPCSGRLPLHRDVWWTWTKLLRAAAGGTAARSAFEGLSAPVLSREEGRTRRPRCRHRKVACTETFPLWSL
jgi:SAM-dependent methyltransferase